MAKTRNQKAKILYLLKLFQEETDEEHPISRKEIEERLADMGIRSERKSLYDDIETLKNFGLDIAYRKERPEGYYLAQREFELPELKLLVDAVQSSRFITEKKSDILIRKIEKLTSRHEAGKLQRQVVVADRIKAMNESIYYNVDKLHTAIAQNRQITFRYFDYDVNKQKVFRHGGKRYQVSPAGLLRSDESYYLVALADGEKRHYRVDRMAQTQLSGQPRQPGCEQLDLAAYTRRHFGMFSGEERQVKLRCPNRLAHVMLDRFGLEVMLVPDGEDHFTLTADVAVSQQFFGWLFGLGGEVEVLAPREVRQALADQLSRALEQYRI